MQRITCFCMLKRFHEKQRIASKFYLFKYFSAVSANKDIAVARINLEASKSKATSNLKESQLNDHSQPSERALGGLKSIPRLLPSHEYVGAAAKKARAVEVDNTIRNSRIRACKHAAATLSMFSRELTIPLGSVVDGFRVATTGLLRLHPFERILATLTLRNMEREGHGTLEAAINSVKSLRKDTSICIKTYISAGANAETAKEVPYLLSDGDAS